MAKAYLNKFENRDTYSFIHSELGPNHVMVDEKNNAYLIDIQGAKFCDVEAELNFLEIRFGKGEIETGNNIDKNRMAFYHIAHCIGNLYGAVVLKERRNAANDPVDDFESIMFEWGNCQGGDRLVMERKLRRFPNDIDSSLNFTPGILFFFKYDELIKHPKAIFEGVLPLKIKDEVVLNDWIYAIIVPLSEKKMIEKVVPTELEDRVYYIENNCKDIWEWSEKIYEFVKEG